MSFSSVIGHAEKTNARAEGFWNGAGTFLNACSPSWQGSTPCIGEMRGDGDRADDGRHQPCNACIFHRCPGCDGADRIRLSREGQFDKVEAEAAAVLRHEATR